MNLQGLKGRLMDFLTQRFASRLGIQQLLRSDVREDLDSFTEWVIRDFCLDFAISPRYHEFPVEKLNYAS